MLRLSFLAAARLANHLWPVLNCTTSIFSSFNIVIALDTTLEHTTPIFSSFSTITMLDSALEHTGHVLNFLNA
jgi:hypothetical protein